MVCLASLSWHANATDFSACPINLWPPGLTLDHILHTTVSDVQEINAEALLKPPHNIETLSK